MTYVVYDRRAATVQAGGSQVMLAESETYSIMELDTLHMMFSFAVVVIEEIKTHKDRLLPG